jgi:hypothetical protein
MTAVKFKPLIFSDAVKIVMTHAQTWNHDNKYR